MPYRSDSAEFLVDLNRASRNRGMPLEILAADITPSGLHYLLAHFDIPLIDVDSWSLEIGGNVGTVSEYSLAELRAMPAETHAVTMECAGNGRALLDPRPAGQPWGLEAVSTSEWTGVSLKHLLDGVGPGHDSVDLVFTGDDRGFQEGVDEHYRRALPVESASSRGVLVAYEMNGRPLEPQHGAPLRLVVPGYYGMAHVKWLRRIEVTTREFHGVQQESYRYRSDENDLGEPVTLMRVRSLMVPPGRPDSVTRERVVSAGPVNLVGRAWSGEGPINHVEVAVDGHWHSASLDPEPVGPFAWQGWSFEWTAQPGAHILNCRATDTQGNTQPSTATWNYHGYGNNAVQQIPITVTSTRT